MYVNKRNKYSSQLSYSSTLGDVTRILFLTKRKYFKIASLEAYLMPCIRLNQILILLDRGEIPSAYVTWAYFSENTRNKYIESDDYILAPAEWNDGDNLWIIDFVAPNGQALKLARELKKHLSSSHNTAEWIKPNGEYTKSVHHLSFGNIS